jgi:hypothetical protein
MSDNATTRPLTRFCDQTVSREYALSESLDTGSLVLSLPKVNCQCGMRRSMLKPLVAIHFHLTVRSERIALENRSC